MIKKFTLLLWLAIPLLSMAQPLPVQYEYDASGNRIVRKTITVPQCSPPAPQDSTFTANSDVETDNYPSLPTFIEKIAQTEIKIYPNPTTEKITLEFSGVVETDNYPSLQLYSLTGQLLQTQPVQDAYTVVSLAGLPAGTYILKVHINNRIEDWKVIKQ